MDAERVTSRKNQVVVRLRVVKDELVPAHALVAADYGADAEWLSAVALCADNRAGRMAEKVRRRADGQILRRAPRAAAVIRTENRALERNAGCAFA